jgi:hypothetical protein
MGDAKREREKVEGLLDELMMVPAVNFPGTGKVTASDNHGVYIIYNEKEEVVHVGGTRSGKRGLWQRLQNHLYGQSSFVVAFFGGDGSKLRGDYKFRCLPVSDHRLRVFLEAYAIGCLCPKHIGLHQPVGGG